jgi:hypothetical protein
LAFPASQYQRLYLSFDEYQLFFPDFIEKLRNFLIIFQIKRTYWLDPRVVSEASASVGDSIRRVAGAAFLRAIVLSLLCWRGLKDGCDQYSQKCKETPLGPKLLRRGAAEHATHPFATAKGRTRFN